MSFTVGALPNSGWEHALPLLDSLGRTQAPASDIEHWLSHDDGAGMVVVLHRRPEFHIAAGIEQGKTPSQACQNWQTHANQLLAWLRKNRRRACLVETDTLLAPKAKLDVLAERVGANHSDVPKAEIPVITPISLLLALQTVQQSEPCQTILAELQASTLPLVTDSFEAPVLDIDTLANSLNAESVKAAERLDALRKEAAELARVSEKLKADAVTAEEKQRDNERKIQELGQKNQQLEQQIDAGTEEASLLLKQLHLVQEELESKLQKIKQLETQLAKSEQQCKKAEKSHGNISEALDQAKQQSEKAKSSENSIRKELEKLKQEKNQAWRQGQKECQELNEKLKAAEEESSLLLEQLHLVQDELQARYAVGEKPERKLITRNASSEKTSTKESTIGDGADKAEGPVTGKPSQQSFLSKLLGLKTPEQKLVERHAKLIRESGLFDEQWYLETYPDVAENDMDPVKHYLKFGAFEYRNPSNEFDTAWYTSTYQDVADKGMNPLLHYIKFGESEGRAPNAAHDSVAWN